MKNIILISLSALLFSCAGVSVRPYRVDVLKKLSKKSTQKLSVGDVTSKAQFLQATDSSFTCRLMNFSLPNEMPIREYIHKAIISELKLNDMYSLKGKKIDVEILEMDLSSQSDAHWKITTTYKVGKRKFPVTTKYSYNWSFVALTVCQDAANALEEALRENIYEFLKQL